MKKVMIGLLILIPILILLSVALVTNIVSLNAHIAVEDLILSYKGTENTAYGISIPLDDVAGVSIYDYLDAKVYPEKATNKTIEWQIAGDVTYTDESYKQEYDKYVQKVEALKNDLAEKYGDGIDMNFDADEQKVYNDVIQKFYYSEKDDIISAMADVLLKDEKLYPAAVFVDDRDREVLSNTSGKMLIGSYCNFTVRAVAENVSKTISVSVVGYDVESVTFNLAQGEDNSLNIGESMRLLPSYTPIDSIVNKTIWTSSDNSVLSVDGNGVVTAVGIGNATITLKASVYTTENNSDVEYVEGRIDIGVISNGASSVFGNRLVTSKSTLTLEEMGVSASATFTGLVNNGDGTYTFSGDYATATIDGKVLEIVRCASDDIVIKNKDFYVRNNGYVLAVGENTLKLGIDWADMLNNSAVDGVVWSSSDESIAKVDANGNVEGLSDGIVTITASRGDDKCELELNLRRKLSSIQLRTSNASLAIGLARETVFASEKYVDVSVDNRKVQNSTLLVVQGEPEDATDSELLAFYSAYSFEIIEGGAFAHIDENVPNRVIFDSQNLEGKGKQTVKVRVKAKYPKYESVTKFTTEDVTLTVVYGVAVENYAQLVVAARDQESYAKANMVVLDENESLYWSAEGSTEKYVVRRSNYASKKYSIAFENDCMYEQRFEADGVTPIEYVGWWEAVAFYGNVYGNNKKLYTMEGTMQEEGYLLRIAEGGVTLSNIILRGSELGTENPEVDDTSDLHGNLCEINPGRSRYFADDNTGITIEYSILENGRKAINVYNSDLTIKGCVLRNLTKPGIYIPLRMENYDGEVDENGKLVVYPIYSHVDMHNLICSNSLGSMMSIAYESFTMKDGTMFRFVEGEKCLETETDVEKIAESARLEKENEDFFMEHFYKNGINAVVNQTGFLRAYNWMDIDNASLIQTGTASIDSILTSAFGTIVRKEQNVYNNYVYKDGEKEYLHFAFIVSGVHLSRGIFDAATYLELNMQDSDYNGFNIKDLDYENMDLGPLNYIAKPLLSKMSLTVYGYKNDVDIVPSSTYQLNAKLIAELHA